jgi:hypothetical protein
MQLLTKMTVGSIKTGLRAKLFKPVKPLPEDPGEKEVWKLVSKKMCSGAHAVFQFRSAGYKLAGVLPYFDHCGRYYTVQAESKL